MLYSISISDMVGTSFEAIYLKIQTVNEAKIFDKINLSYLKVLKRGQNKHVTYSQRQQVLLL